MADLGWIAGLYGVCVVLTGVVECGAMNACKLSVFGGRIFLADFESNESKIALNYKVVR